MPKYVIYEHDGATYRAPAGGDIPNPVSDVKSGSTWKPYQGDRMAPVVYGDRVGEDDK